MAQESSHTRQPNKPTAEAVAAISSMIVLGPTPDALRGNTQHSPASTTVSGASDISDFVPEYPGRTPSEDTKHGARITIPHLPQQQHNQYGPFGLIRHDEVEGSAKPDLRKTAIEKNDDVARAERKCTEVHILETEPTDEQWRKYSAQHRELLIKCQDFFLDIQHPRESETLETLASKYGIPGRMWRHGMYGYLELLRRYLPKSREHMLNYIYLSYNMMAVLYEAIPSHNETWIECLGNLGRYHMAAMEDGNIHGREIWTDVSRQCYKKASDLSPGRGRLYHHLATLARPNWFQQLLYYAKSLCVPEPVEWARESILELFESRIHLGETAQPTESPLMRCYACMVMRTGAEQQRLYAQKFLATLDDDIARIACLFLQPAYTIGIINCCAMVEYGSKSNVIFQVINPEPDKEAREDKPEVAGDAESVKSMPTDEFFQALALACGTARVVLDRRGDPNVWPFAHVTLVFIYHLTFFHAEGGMEHVEKSFPWTPLVNLLNTLLSLSSSGADAKHESDVFPGRPEDGPPLPEDFAMRGLLWAARYHPDGWFAGAKVDDEERGIGLARMAGQRMDRILWLGCCIARCGKWILYNSEDRAFSVMPEFAVG